MSQALDNARPPLPSTATHQEGENTGASQSAAEVKKPSFDQEHDLRLQCIEALSFVQDVSPDLSSNDIFYLERTRDILQRLVDEEHDEYSHFMGFC